MSERFPLSDKLGYSPNQVDEFLMLAKQQYLNPGSKIVDVTLVRGQRFDLVKHGYKISSVDLAMEKLEDVFAQRELESKYDQQGFEVFISETNELLNMLSERVSRARKKRFARRRWPNRGYSKRQVDLLCSQVAKHLDGSQLLTAQDLRLSVFKTKRGGYAEHQVDAFIDKVVELLQRQNIVGKTS